MADVVVDELVDELVNEFVVDLEDELEELSSPLLHPPRARAPTTRTAIGAAVRPRRAYFIRPPCNAPPKPAKSANPSVLV